MPWNQRAKQLIAQHIFNRKATLKEGAMRYLFLIVNYCIFNFGYGFKICWKVCKLTFSSLALSLECTENNWRKVEEAKDHLWLPQLKERSRLCDQGKNTTNPQEDTWIWGEQQAEKSVTRPRHIKHTVVHSEWSLRCSGRSHHKGCAWSNHCWDHQVKMKVCSQPPGNKAT